MNKPIINKTLSCLLSAGLVVGAMPAQAEVDINGFANIVVGTTFNDDDALYGFDGDLDFKNESLFALQISSDIGDSLKATAQVVARGADDFDAEFAWAYLTYEIDDHSNLKFGRLRIPFYKYSEFLEVGYAYHHLRPPQSVYGAIDFNNTDGVSYNYNTMFGDWDSSIQLLYSRYEGESSPGGVTSDSDLQDLISVIWGMTKDEWSFRLGYTQCGECNIDFPFQDVLGFDFIGTVTAAAGQGVADDFTFTGDRGSFTNFGWGYDEGTWFVEGEIAQLEVPDSFLADFGFWYVSGGYRADDFVYYATYEESEGDPKTGLVGGVPAVPLGGGLTLQNVAAAFIESGRSETSRLSLGMVYNFQPGAAFKLEYHINQNELDLNDVRALLSAAVVVVF